MSGPGFLSSLSLGTMVIVLIVAAALAAWFFRKRENRKPMEGVQERNIAADLDRRQSPPDGQPDRHSRP